MKEIRISYYDLYNAGCGDMEYVLLSLAKELGVPVIGNFWLELDKSCVKKIIRWDDVRTHEIVFHWEEV